MFSVFSFHHHSSSIFTDPRQVFASFLLFACSVPSFLWYVRIPAPQQPTRPTVCAACHTIQWWWRKKMNEIKLKTIRREILLPFSLCAFFLCAMAVKWVASHTATQTSEVSHGFYDEKPAVCSIAYHMHLTWYFPTTDIEQKQQQASKCRDDERHERAAVEDFSLQAKRRDERRDFFHFQPVLFYSLSSSSSRWSSTRSLHSGLTARNVVFRVATSEHCVERRCNNEVKFLLVFGSEHAEYLILTHSKIWYIWNLRCLSETRASCCCADHRSTFYIHF